MAEDVRLRRLVAEADAGKVLDEVAEQRIGQAILVGPRRIAEDAVKGLRVGLLDPAHGLLQRLADVGRDHAHIAPVAILRNLEAVVLRELGIFLVTAGFRQRRRIFLVIHIRDALEEEQREDVGLEIGRIHRAAQDIRGLPEVGFKLAKGKLILAHYLSSQWRRITIIYGLRLLLPMKSESVGMLMSSVHCPRRRRDFFLLYLSGPFQNGLRRCFIVSRCLSVIEPYLKQNYAEHKNVNVLMRVMSLFFPFFISDPKLDGMTLDMLAPFQGHNL